MADVKISEYDGPIQGSRLTVLDNIKFDQADTPDAVGMIPAIGDNGLFKLFRISNQDTTWMGTNSSDVSLSTSPQEVLSVIVDEDVTTDEGYYQIGMLVSNTGILKDTLILEAKIDGTVVNTYEVEIEWNEVERPVLFSGALSNDISAASTVSVDASCTKDNLVIKGTIANSKLVVGKAATPLTKTNLAAMLVTDPVVESARIGDSTGEVDINKDGVELKGGATVWDDIRTAPMTAPQSGSRAPTLETVANDGSATTGYAIDMDGSNGNTIPYYSAMNTQTMTINVWMKLDSTGSVEILDRQTSGYFEFYVSNGDLKMKWANRTVTASGVITAGQTQMVTAVMSLEGANTRVKLYVNNSLAEESVVSSTIGTASTDGYILGEYFNGGWELDGVVDGLYLYNVALTDSQVSELYNSGAGTTSHPTGITETTDVIAKFDFNEGTGTTADNDSTLGAGNDITLALGTTWVSGLMGVSSGSIGVMALSFPPNQVTEFFGSVQFPHKYKEGTTIFPHVHWAGEDTSPGDVVWKLEYLWVNIGAALQANTTIVSHTVANDTVTAGLHRMNDVPSAGIAGTGKTISSIMQYRLYRDGADSADTYGKKVYLSEFDIHYEIDTIGSKTAMSK